MIVRRMVAVGVVTVVAWVVAAMLPLSNPVSSDVGLYAEVAARMADGQMPYRDFFLEYPPGAAVAFWLARLIPVGYGAGFSMLACGALVITAMATVAAAGRLGFGARRQMAAGLVVAVTPIALGRFIVAERFDIVMSAALAVMIVCALDRRFAVAWAMLAVAVLVKLVPILLVPLMVLWQARAKPATLRRDLLVGAGVTVAGVLPFVALAPAGVWSTLRYHLVRPLQIESIGAAYMRGIAVLADRSMPATYSAGSHNLAGTGAAVIAGIMTVALVIGLGLLTVWCARCRAADDRWFVAAIATALALIMACSKVLSPQFVVWILPAALLVAGPYGRVALALAASVLVITQLEYPHAYFQVVDGEPSAVGLLGVRNLLIVMLVAACWPRRPQTSRLNGRIAEARPSGSASMTAP